MKKTNILKENLKQMAPRPFGEKFGEWLIGRIESNIQPRKDGSHDGMLDGKKCEIKISRAIEKTISKLSFSEKLLSESSTKFADSKSNIKLQRIQRR